MAHKKSKVKRQATPLAQQSQPQQLIEGLQVMQRAVHGHLTSSNNTSTKLQKIWQKRNHSWSRTSFPFLAHDVAS